MSSHYIKRKIPTEQLQEIRIIMKGQEKSCEGLIVINGVEFGLKGEDPNHGKGIAGFELAMPADETPSLTVHYHPHLATKVACEALGIEKRPSYPSYVCRREDGELICELLHEGDMS